jgi:hypothetical protein
MKYQPRASSPAQVKITDADGVHSIHSHPMNPYNNDFVIASPNSDFIDKFRTQCCGGSDRKTTPCCVNIFSACLSLDTCCNIFVFLYSSRLHLMVGMLKLYTAFPLLSFLSKFSCPHRFYGCLLFVTALNKQLIFYFLFRI